VSKVWESLLSIGLGGLGGTIVSVLLGPFSAWKQESVRRDRAARSELMKEVSSFKNHMLREIVSCQLLEKRPYTVGIANEDLHEIVIKGGDFLLEIRKVIVCLDNPDLNKIARSKVHRILSDIIGLGWVDFLNTCRLPKEVEERKAKWVGLDSSTGLVGNEILLKNLPLSSEIIEKIISKTDCISSVLRKSPGLLKMWIG